MGWSRFEAMVAGEKDFARELIEVFFASAEQTLAEMRATVEAQDRLQLLRAVHKLKGASANLCADALSGLCQQLEAEAGLTGCAMPALAAHIDAIAQTYQHTVQELQQYLARS
jgi:HPt (histidine-containing phosphotransfer) domain-containing protein